MKKNNAGTIGSVGDKAIERTNALTLIHDSHEYYEYFKRGSPLKNSDISKVSYFLLMRTLELSLKAILKLKEGISTLELKTSFGHDVNKLLLYSVKKGYITLEEEEPKIALRILNNFYKDKDFEYTEVGYKELPSMSYIISLIELCHAEFRKAAQNSEIRKYL